jgi:hypothetical protein
MASKLQDDNSEEVENKPKVYLFIRYIPIWTSSNLNLKIKTQVLVTWFFPILVQHPITEWVQQNVRNT